MFGKIVSKILVGWGPINVELALVNSILEPVETHVGSLGSFLLGGAIDDTVGDGVIDL